MTGTVALIVAAGRGERAGGGTPKQFRAIGGKSVVTRSLDLFLGHPAIDRVLVVIGPNDAPRYGDIAPQHEKLLAPVFGGDDRQEFGAPRAWWRWPASAPKRVLIHDAARPFASPALIDRVIAALDTDEAVVPTVPVAATLKRQSEGHVSETVPREGLYAAETPQGFHFGPILAAHERAATDGLRFTDDAAVAEWAGIPVRMRRGRDDQYQADHGA